MSKDPKIYLGHILECVVAIQSYIKGITREQFEDDIQKQDAVLRRLEIIGEATKNVPENFRTQHPQINWHKIMGTRNILVHQYKEVDLDIVWDTATKGLDELKSQIESLLSLS